MISGDVLNEILSSYEGHCCEHDESSKDNSHRMSSGCNVLANVSGREAQWSNSLANE